MHQFSIPTLIYLALSLAYIGGSDAPFAAHLIALALLALGFLIPSIWATLYLSPLKRRTICTAFALLSILAWDGLAHAVVAKQEQWSIICTATWVYVLGVTLLSTLSLLAARLVAPPHGLHAS